MEIELLLQKKKEIYASLIEFIDGTENTDIESLIKNIEENGIFKKQKRNQFNTSVIV